jgi:hypothetical protein
MAVVILLLLVVVVLVHHYIVAVVLLGVYVRMVGIILVRSRLAVLVYSQIHLDACGTIIVVIVYVFNRMVMLLVANVCTMFANLVVLVAAVEAMDHNQEHVVVGMGHAIVIYGLVEPVV